MKENVLIISLFMLVATSLGQKRIINPELHHPVRENASIFPDNGVPMPEDSLQLANAVSFFEGRIENLDGQEDPSNQAVILYCIAELNRLHRKHDAALLALIDSHRSLQGPMDTLDRIRIQSRFCFNWLALSKSGADAAYPETLVNEIGFDRFDQLMLNTLAMLEALEDEQTLLAMYTLAFEYYQLAGKSKEAYSFGEKLMAFKVYVAGQQLKRKLASLEDSFEMKQKDREIQLLNNQRILYEAKIKGSTRQLWVIIAGVVFLLIFAFTLLHRVRTIRKTRDLLQAKAAQLQHEKERARKNELFKEQFLANVSHEIRTPLNAIMGITNILIKNEYLKPQEKYLLAMQESAKNLLVLINDILDLSKLEAGKMELLMTPFNPRDILDELYAKLKGKAINKGLSLRMEVDEKVPEILTGDGYVLSNIIMNLVSNAITFTIRGSVEVTCRVREQEEKTVVLQFEVRDTGMGIVPEKQDKILQTFVKVYEKSAVQYEGSGLELAIINQLVELQGGSIRLESSPMIGTTFYVEIPYQLSKGSLLPEANIIVQEECELRDIRVLLVEDNEFNVMVASTELESVIDGLQLDVAENGQVALEKLQQHEYQLVLMDVQMPVMDGYEATRRIRIMNGSVGQVPIIAMSANVLQQEIDKCLKEGMNDYISKPFDTMELLQKMRKLLVPVV
jgi:signal transduction histidine kinase/ActR/RegA family two-component response regulator